MTTNLYGILAKHILLSILYLKYKLFFITERFYIAGNVTFAIRFGNLRTSIGYESRSG